MLQRNRMPWLKGTVFRDERRQFLRLLMAMAAFHELPIQKE